MKKILLILVSVFILTSCQSHDFNFKGDSENWYAEVLTQKNGDRQEQSFKIKYEGKNLEKVKNKDITFSFQSDNGLQGQITQKLSESGTLESNSPSSCSGCNFLNKESEIVFTIEWNGEKEEFILKN
ncbi:membrane lipoprotein lipid attachment site-containing protein [Viridibacillus sp. NPDC096237]|uniref:membrane lipoprotein lipid attachment site-containing protein n=1 Tax=Viridibacillus sp. NPDC096237 TaxID=3390721 RepID=UPI003D0651CA